MNSVMDKTRLAVKQYEINKRRALIRKQIESKKEMKQNGRKQKREIVVEDIDLGSFFELATTDKIYVNKIHLHEIKTGLLSE